MPIHNISRCSTLCIHPIWMRNAVNGGLQPQPWHCNIIQARRAQPYHISPKMHPHLNTYYGYNNALICPSTASQGAKPKPLCIHPIWMWDAVNLGSQPQPWHDTTTSYRLGHTPFHLKSPPACTYNTAIMMHPYAHPQHLKVLKLFAYMVWCKPGWLTLWHL